MMKRQNGNFTGSLRHLMEVFTKIPHDSKADVCQEMLGLET
jgi:hypothetical protein